jgi:parallel beta-helix repeat protein
MFTTNNILIENCSTSMNYKYGGSIKHPAYGIIMVGCNGSIVWNSTLDSNDYDGLSASSCQDIEIANCFLSGNGHGGIHISGCSDLALLDCRLSNNSQSDIALGGSVSVLMRNNEMTGMGMSIGGSSASHWNSQDIDTSNTVNGRPVIYWKNATSGTLPLGASQVILASCSNVTVEGQDLQGVGYGLLMGYSSWNTIRNNTCALDIYGIYLVSSNNNSFFWNSIVSNTAVGLNIYSGSDNVIWNNLFAGNAVQANEESWPHNNKWNISGMGNYWSEWTSPDINLDGIVDNPYTLPSGSKDHYPLAVQPPGIPEFNVLMPAMGSLVIVAFLVRIRRRM